MDTRGLGTLLRAVTARLDGDVQALYDESTVAFRPRFFPVVQELVEHGARTVGQLADAAGVSQPAITQTLAQMAKHGLVEVTRGADARERQVVLSVSGKRVADELRPFWAAASKAAAELDGELPHPLAAILRATLEALDRQPFRDRIQRKLDV